MRLRWRLVFLSIILFSCTTTLLMFYLLRDVDSLAARVNTFQETFRKSLENTNILDGINLLTGKKEWSINDHENASKYDQWVIENQHRRLWPVKADIKSSKNGTHLHPWQLFHADMTKDQMYSRNAHYMPALLKSLATSQIVEVGLYHGGSQLKLTVKLGDGSYAILKPIRSARHSVYGYDEEQPFWLDMDRHNAEVAAFHLDRILNFRRSPPCAGRIINMTRDIVEKTTDKPLLETFFRKGPNTCFSGRCAPWFCNLDHPICGKGDLLEVSMCHLLPNYHGNEEPLMTRPYPWSQGVRETKMWKDQNICEDLLQNPANAEGRFLLDLIEQAIFDFLILNYDRHHFDMLQQFGSEGFVVLLDNGKGFGNPDKDDPSLLAPLAQCCIIRQTTYQYLKKVHHSRSEGLSDHIRHTLLQDTLSTVITEPYMTALDRRLGLVVDMVEDCITLHGTKRVLVDKLKLPINNTNNNSRTKTET